jgi:hypothetical protein
LATGEVIEAFRVPADGCGPSFAAADCIVTAFGGVVVQHDIVYAVAGFQAGYGVDAATLRLTDGTVAWQRNDAGGSDPVEGIGSMGGLTTELENWQLGALSRSNGQIVWTIDLPCRPAWNGLSFARDGSILLSLWDGSIACYL